MEYRPLLPTRYQFIPQAPLVQAPVTFATKPAGRAGGSFKANVGRHRRAERVIADLGCGQGLYLRDLSERHEGGRLYGLDATPVMIDHARVLRYRCAPPVLAVQDLEKGAVAAGRGQRGPRFYDRSAP